jgi:hypothetical protein
MSVLQYIRLFGNCIRRGDAISVISIYKAIHDNFKWSGIIIGISVFIGLVVCFSLPKEYRSSVQISLEESSSPVNTGSKKVMDLFITSNNKDAVNVESYPDLVLNQAAIEVIAQFKLPITSNGNKVEEKSLREIIEKNTTNPWWSKIADVIISPLRDDADCEARFISELQRRILVSSGKSKNILVVETLMQDPLTSAVLCDSVVCFLNNQLVQFNKQKLSDKQLFLQTQVEGLKHDYYQTLENAAKYMDTHQGRLLMRDSIVGECLSREAEIRFDAYLKVYKEFILSKFAHDHPQDRFFTIIPAHVAVRSTWPKKVAIIFIFGFLSMMLVVISATIKAGCHSINIDEVIK